MFCKSSLATFLTLALSAAQVDCFGVLPTSPTFSRSVTPTIKLYNSLEESEALSSDLSRRNVLTQGLAVGGALLVSESILVEDASAAVGALPEFSETNAILQGLTVNVADQSQQKSMIEFLVNGFSFEVLRQRIRGPIEETVRRTDGFQISSTFPLELGVSHEFHHLFIVVGFWTRAIVDSR